MRNEIIFESLSNNQEDHDSFGENWYSDAEVIFSQVREKRAADRNFFNDHKGSPENAWRNW
jgi:hypothetical protein